MWWQLGLPEKPKIKFSPDLAKTGADSWLLFVYEGAFSFPTYGDAFVAIERYYRDIAIANCIMAKPKTKVVQ